MSIDAFWENLPDRSTPVTAENLNGWGALIKAEREAAETAADDAAAAVGAAEGAAASTDTVMAGRVTDTSSQTRAALNPLLHSKGNIASGTDVNTLQTAGIYNVPSSAVSSTLTNLPVSFPGVLEVGMAGTSVGFQRYTTFGAKNSTPNQGTWIRFRLNTTTWDRWWEVGEAYLRGNIPQPVDLNTFTSPGVFTVNNSTAVDNTTNLPVAFPGVLENLRTPGAAFATQRFTVYGVNAAVYWRVSSDVSGNWTAWKRLDNEAIPTPQPAGMQHALRVTDLRKRVGPVRPGGKGVVALVFDHGTNNFATEVLPALQANNLRATLALNADMYNPSAPRYPHDNATTWTQIKGWHDNDGIEIANHGRTHGEFSTVADITTEIVTGRNELEANLPGVKVDTYVQTASTFGAFNSGNTAEAYWSTDAGRIIYDAHAVITGTTPGGPYPLDGEPITGMVGNWIDTGAASISAMQTAITNAAAAGKGILVRCHPELLNTSDRTTTAELAGFLSWLAGQVTAGAVEVRPLREMAVAINP